MDTPDDAGAYDDGWNGPGANTSNGAVVACSEPAPPCGSLAPMPSVFASAQEAANVIVGRWSFCPGNTSGFYPPDQVGEEFAPDGTYYQLVADATGRLVRNADPRTVGTWEVKLGPNDVVEVHTYGNGIQRAVDLSACPRALDALGLEVPAP
jgi:hypothetical protein